SLHPPIIASPFRRPVSRGKGLSRLSRRQRKSRPPTVVRAAEGVVMRIFVAGAAGAIGQRLVPQLIAAGHQVTASTRRPDGQGRLRAMGAEPVLMDGLDPAAVGEAVARARPEIVIHQMTALGG